MAVIGAPLLAAAGKLIDPDTLTALKGFGWKNEMVPAGARAAEESTKFATARALLTMLFRFDPRNAFPSK